MVNSKMEQSMAILDGLINLVAASKRNIKMVIIKENFEICVHISYDDKKIYLIFKIFVKAYYFLILLILY